jgi:hypothetical protein
MSRKIDYKIYNLSSDGWGYLLQYRDGKIYDGFGKLVNLSFGNSGSGSQGPQGPQGHQGIQGPTGSNATYYVQVPPSPSHPKLGDRWYDLSTGIEYVYINDGNSYQWVTPFTFNTDSQMSPMLNLSVMQEIIKRLDSLEKENQELKRLIGK